MVTDREWSGPTHPPAWWGHLASKRLFSTDTVNMAPNWGADSRASSQLCVHVGRQGPSGCCAPSALQGLRSPRKSTQHLALRVWRRESEVSFCVWEDFSLKDTPFYFHFQNRPRPRLSTACQNDRLSSYLTAPLYLSFFLKTPVGPDSRFSDSPERRT